MQIESPYFQSQIHLEDHQNCVKKEERKKGMKGKKGKMNGGRKEEREGRSLDRYFKRKIIKSYQTATKIYTIANKRTGKSSKK